MRLKRNSCKIAQLKAMQLKVWQHSNAKYRKKYDDTRNLTYDQTDLPEGTRNIT